MRIVHFDPLQEFPIIEAKIKGSKGARRIRLVFDTGAGSTQIDTGRMEAVGYSAKNAQAYISVEGPAGDIKEGYLVIAHGFTFFGRHISNLPVGVYDFDNFSKYGIDGLLGWDVIRQLHLDMDGPNGMLKVF